MAQPENNNNNDRAESGLLHNVFDTQSRPCRPDNHLNCCLSKFEGV